ncbi:hypothetical protein MPRM_25160 [Mycobacterium parmense]|uniref:Uncharacterized protein n=2 Tax=Mycobacterium parmense TaxID=185642 RepID=A0A7I7YTN2_9MYCO|nr:hypothetical protein MPRM_25160 [Mycobacterium parmense]
MHAMVRRHETVEIPIEDVQVGFMLLIPRSTPGAGGPPQVFRVDRTKVKDDGEAGEPRMKLTMDLSDGKPWVKEYFFGTTVRRIVRTYDDGR